jgi:hypothetical protein
MAWGKQGLQYVCGFTVSVVLKTVSSSFVLTSLSKSERNCNRRKNEAGKTVDCIYYYFSCFPLASQPFVMLKVLGCTKPMDFSFSKASIS